MQLLVLVVSVAVFELLAMRFGADSRLGFGSHRCDPGREVNRAWW